METAAPTITRRCNSASSARTGLSEALILKMNVSLIYGAFDVLQMKQWIIITAALLQAYLTSSSNLSSPSFPLPPLALCSGAAAPASIPSVLPFIPSPYHQTSSAAAPFISSHFDSLCPLPAPLFSTCKNAPFNIHRSIISRFSVSYLPLSGGEQEWVSMLVNYRCEEGTNGETERLLAAWLSSSRTWEPGIRETGGREGVLN